jgi:FKBP12-rapamycin complex-associated protein
MMSDFSRVGAVSFQGHEDLRQDERAMQLFGLVNALLLNDSRTVSANQADYSIQRYAVMPLSPTAGLISWVPSCDTLHDLIRSYRESRKIMLDVENKLILQVAPNKMYDALPVMHKLEVRPDACVVGSVLYNTSVTVM